MHARLGDDVPLHLDALANDHTVAGNRYNEQANREADTKALQ